MFMLLAINAASCAGVPTTCGAPAQNQSKEPDNSALRRMTLLISDGVLVDGGTRLQLARLRISRAPALVSKAVTAGAEIS
jgi:hypothetical protein